MLSKWIFNIVNICISFIQLLFIILKCHKEMTKPDPESLTKNLLTSSHSSATSKPSLYFLQQRYDKMQSMLFIKTWR